MKHTIPVKTGEKGVNFRIGYEDMGFPGGASGKEATCQCRRHKRRVRCLGREDPLENGMATHSSILAWRIPWTEELGGLRSIASQKVRYD